MLSPQPLLLFTNVLHFRSKLTLRHLQSQQSKDGSWHLVPWCGDEDRLPTFAPTDPNHHRPYSHKSEPKKELATQGSHCSNLAMRSLQAMTAHWVYRGRYKTNMRSYFHLIIKSKVFTHRKILNTSSISESPGNRGRLVIISAKIVPTDHMSMGKA